MEQLTPLAEARNVVIHRLTMALAPEQVELLMSQGPDALDTRLERDIRYEIIGIG